MARGLGLGLNGGPFKLGAGAPALPGMGGAPAPLPPLRDDLRLFPAPPEADGSPTWTIHDPVRGRYFRIGLLAFRLLSHWHLADPDRVLRAALDGTTLEAGPDDLEDMQRFLRANNLIAGTAPGQVDSYLAQVKAGKVSWGTWLLHNYLFIRIPLLRPDRFLSATWPLVRPLFSRAFLILVLVLGLLGLVLALRRWDEFGATFLHFFTMEGLALMGCTIAVTKVLHEFGHAYMAKRFGCRVHSMGVAFLVMFPVLFTDVTDAWRLVSRRQRLLIGAAGMLVELSLALLATLLWSFLPDGPLRSATFMVATVTWVTTLAVNLNPMMKFDGYFLLADWLGIQNLQDRSFALARWRLREWLFGFGEPVPEVVPPRQHRIMLIWAYSTWIWRFFLFLGIALLVYHAFFKVLGIFLMIVELAWFIARPMSREVAEWWKRRDKIRLNRQLFGSLLLLGAGLWLLLTPWQGRVVLPATLEAAEYTVLYPTAPARIQQVLVEPGQRVEAGDLLYVLESPDLEQEILQVTGELELLQRLIQRQAASSETLDQLGVLESQLATGLANLRGLRERQAKLRVQAPMSGVLRDMPPGLKTGLWVNESMPLGRVVDFGQTRVRAYVTGADLGRVQTGAAASFHPDDPAQPRQALRVRRVEQLGLGVLDNPYLDSTYGGPVSVRQDRERGAVPVEALYRVYLAPDSARQNSPGSAPDQVVRGWVRVEAEAVSPVVRLWRFVAAVLVRESGF